MSGLIRYGKFPNMKKSVNTLIAAMALMLLIALPESSPAQQPPITVSIISPQSGSRLVVGTDVEILVELADGEQLQEVELFVDNVSVGKREKGPFIFTVEHVSPNTVHRLRAVGKTKAGDIAIDTRLFKEEDPSEISVSVKLVTVYASVTDENGNYIRDLKQDDFTIEEDGVSQDIAVYSSEITPLTVAILMDISSSMIGERIVRAQNAAVELVDNIIRPEDAAMVLGFDHRLFLFQALTNDHAKLDDAIRMTGPNGGTALYDAVAGTAHKLYALKGKRAIILLSDGDDTDSRFGFEEVLDYLQKSGVIVYSVGLQTLTVAQTRLEETRRTIRNLKDMADISGGQAYFPSFISHLPQIYSAIGKDLTSQYTLAYYPKNKTRDGKWRTITVRIKDRPDLVVRHRKGYYAD